MFNFKCSHCTSSFQARSKLDAHILANHRCRLCAKEFKDKNALKEHKKNCESHKLLLFRCEDCGKTNAHKGHHQKHVETCIKNLAKLCPDHVEKFTGTIYVSKEKYHNGDYEGNEINKFFEKLDQFEEILDKNIILLLMDSGQ